MRSHTILVFHRKRYKSDTRYTAIVTVEDESELVCDREVTKKWCKIDLYLQLQTNSKWYNYDV